MSYQDMTANFSYKDLITWTDMDFLAENDAYLLTLYGGYRRPVLQYSSATAVNVENNTGTSNQTRIWFTDGTYREVTEDTASTHKYRQFIITATAEYTAGTEDSGMRTTEAEGANTWYAIYAVKSAINTANFVLVGTTTLPLQANFGTLNGYFGTNGWVYLGLIRNGNGLAGNSDILTFKQTGNTTRLANVFVGATSTYARLGGIQMATAGNVASCNWAYASGTGASQVPANIGVAMSTGNMLCTGANHMVGFGNTSTGQDFATAFSITGDPVLMSAVVDITKGLYIAEAGAVAVTGSELCLTGWFDGALGVGANPLL